MLKKIDKWICECLLYLDYKQKEKGLDSTFRLLLLLVLSFTMFINFISGYFIFNLCGFKGYELMLFFPITFSSILFFLLFTRYHYKDNYILISKKQECQKKLWGTVVIYIICSFALMWILIILAVIG